MCFRPFIFKLYVQIVFLQFTHSFAAAKRLEEAGRPAFSHPLLLKAKSRIDYFLMKRRSLLIPLCLLLCGCKEPVFSQSPIDPSFEPVQGDGYYRPSSFPSIDTASGEIDVSSRQKAVELSSTSADKKHAIPSTGKVPLLVIPVGFSGSGEVDVGAIEDAFFGGEGWKRLSLYGYVCDQFYPCRYDLEHLYSLNGGTACKNALSAIYVDALSWAKENYPDYYQAMGEFYGDDPIPAYFLYDAPYSGMDGGMTDRSSMLWAFSINSPAPISWSSLYMMGDSIDPHTYIHETGHLLGLSDYYDTVDSSFLHSPLGRMDMMDCSLGDHNAFSKLLLGWGMPFVATSSCEITIHQSELNNEMILLSPDWNGTPYDEYVLLELYTPSLLNADDAYSGRSDGARLFGRPGIKAYRVDARLGAYENNKLLGEVGPNMVTDGKSIDYLNDNSLSSPYLIQLLDKESGSATLPSYYVAGDSSKDFEEGGRAMHQSESLFYEGDGVGGSSFSDLSFSYGEFPISFEVTSLTSTSATIRIEFR